MEKDCGRRRQCRRRDRQQFSCSSSIFKSPLLILDSCHTHNHCCGRIRHGKKDRPETRVPKTIDCHPCFPWQASCNKRRHPLLSSHVRSNLKYIHTVQFFGGPISQPPYVQVSLGRSAPATSFHSLA